MGTLTVDRPPSRRAPSASKAPSRSGWWGRGLPPWERWHGVTIALEAEKRNGRWESHDGRYYYDAFAADRAVAFFSELLKHHIGEFAGKPFDLLDYQRLLLTMPIFGWKQVEDGRRRFRKLFAFLPKGAGKSPWGAGTGLYCTLYDDEPAAEVYAVAADTKQARIVHDNARIMVEESPPLLEMCEVLRDSIYHAASRSKYAVLSSDASTKHGFRPHAVIFDELHAQPDRRLFEALKKSLVKRRQPLLVMITHAGDDDEGICYEEYDYAKKVLSGTVNDPTCLPVIFEADAHDDWTDPKVWKSTNPGHGITVQHTAIAAECEEAKAEPRKLNDFLRYHLNRWVNQATAWIPIDWWDACEGPIDFTALQGLPLAAGLDLSQKYDLTAFVMVFAKPIEGPASVIEVKDVDEMGTVTPKTISLNIEATIVPHFWLPEATLMERVKQDRVPYDQWQKAGLLTVTEGNVIDYDKILSDITGPITQRFPKLKGAQIGYDPAFATDLALKLNARGYTAVEVLQNYKHLSESSQIMEALIKAKRIHHDGHRLLRWNWENVAIKTDDAGRIRPVKPKRAAKRIDGVVASIMGLGRVVLQPTPNTTPIFLGVTPRRRF